MRTRRPKNFFPKFSDVSDHICAIYGHFSVPRDPILPFLRFSGKSHHVAGATRPLWSRPTPGGRSPALWQPNQGQGSEKQPPTLSQGTRGSVGVSGSVGGAHVRRPKDCFSPTLIEKKGCQTAGDLPPEVGMDHSGRVHRWTRVENKGGG